MKNGQYAALKRSLSFIALGVILGVTGIATASAAETGRSIVASDLKQKPYLDAPTIINVPANTPLEVLQRQGGWMQIKTGTHEGWLKLTAVTLGAGSASQGSSGLGTLVNLATTGRSGSSGVTVTTGVRGLGQEELKNAQPNHAAVQKMESFTSAREEAASFAAGGKLQSQQLEYLGTATVSGNTGANLGGAR